MTGALGAVFYSTLMKFIFGIFYCKTRIIYPCCNAGGKECDYKGYRGGIHDVLIHGHDDQGMHFYKDLDDLFDPIAEPMRNV